MTTIVHAREDLIPTSQHANWTVFCDFKSVDARERILYMNYNRVKADVDQLIVEVQQEFKK